VPDAKWTVETFEALRAVLEELTHHCATIKIELVDKIQQDQYGKLQAVVSKVKRTW
jgi:hypothetical protein